MDGGEVTPRLCSVSETCETGGDCRTGICDTEESDTLQCRWESPAESCNNGEFNSADSGTGAETCLDGGGDTCISIGNLCGPGDACSTDADCDGFCYSSVCFSCSNGIIDGDESDVDCGGHLLDMDPPSCNLCKTRCLCRVSPLPSWLRHRLSLRRLRCRRALLPEEQRLRLRPVLRWFSVLGDAWTVRVADQRSDGRVGDVR